MHTYNCMLMRLVYCSMLFYFVFTAVKKARVAAKNVRAGTKARVEVKARMSSSFHRPKTLKLRRKF